MTDAKKIAVRGDFFKVFLSFIQSITEGPDPMRKYSILVRLVIFIPKIDILGIVTTI